MGNPFGAEHSPSDGGPVLDLDVKAPLSKGAPPRGLCPEGDRGGIVFETRRADLAPAVRRYADKLYSQIKDLYASYGVKNAAELYAKAKARQISVPKEEGRKLLRLQTELQDALTRNELPEGYPEKFPPYEYFQGVVDSINERITPNVVTGLDRWKEYELINGELNGRVKIGDRWLPVIDGELVEKIDGQDILDCGDVRNVRGKLNCWAWVSGFPGRPVIDGRFINKVDGKRLVGCANVRNVDGSLNGEVSIDEYTLPVIGGVLIEEIGGQRIADCRDVRNVNGKLNCSVRFEHGLHWLPVINGQAIEEIGGKQIRGCSNIRNVDGKLNGELSFGNGLQLPVIADELIMEVGGRRIDWCGDVQNINGKLNCVIRDNETTLLVMDGQLVEEVDGKKIEDFSEMCNIEGKLYGLLQIDVFEFPVIAGEVVDFKEGLLMVGIDHDDRDEFSDAGGQFTGIAIYRNLNNDEIKKRVVLGEFID